MAAIQLDEFGMSYSLALQKVIGEVKRATTKYDRAHDDAHRPFEWSRQISGRLESLFGTTLDARTFGVLDNEEYEKHLLAIAALATSALAHHERQKGRTQ